MGKQMEKTFIPTWESLTQMQVPDWFSKAKFGIFIHWGVYSVPAYHNEWYPRNMYIKGSEEWEHHRNTYGEHKDFGYKDFIPMFTAEKFDPKQWAELFAAAGAKYVFPVAEHHDGFQMYRSRLSGYNAFEMGPKRDILGELKAAFAERGLHFCASTHRAEHWFFMGHGKEFDSDIKEPLKKGDLYWPAMPEGELQDLQSTPYPSQEYLDDWVARTVELIDEYQPELLYFDWWIEHEAFKEGLKQIAAHYYNCGQKWGCPTAICYKHDAMAFGSGIVDVERGKLAEAKPYIWQTDTAIAKNSWCYTQDLQYKTARQIICDFVDIISKNGNLLLNVGPKADGSIADQDREILLKIGAWMHRNKAAVYGSKPWRTAAEGPTREAEGQFTDNEETPYTAQDIRFTVSGGCINAFIMSWPENGSVTVKSLADSQDANRPHFHGLIREVRILGYEQKPVWEKDEQGLHVQAEFVKSDLPVVLQIETI